MKPSNISKINKMAADVVAKYNLEHPVEIRFIDLTSEVGELGKELLKASNYGSNPQGLIGGNPQGLCDKPQGLSDNPQGLNVTIRKDVSEKIASEIGDVLFSLACIANTLDIDLEDALAGAIDKYHARFTKAGDIGSE